VIDLIILAGGQGTRLKRLFPTLPKTLVPIQGIPFIHFLLNFLLKRLSFSQIIFAVSYESEPIIDYLKAHFDRDLLFSMEEIPLGTGGALKKALQLTHSKQVLVCNGDCFLDFPLDQFLKSHEKNQSKVTIACVKVADCSCYGQIVYDEETKKILTFCEKPDSNQQLGWINAGFYLMQSETILCALPSADSFSLEKEAFPFLLPHCGYSYPCEGTFIDIGTEKNYHDAQTLLLPFLQKECSSNFSMA
jgi:D-glycero-alpha-D-manno-heptose 1-phosphate guanylyltransferase